MPHIVLLGDSVFDNAHYTNGGPDVAGHLRHLLPSPATVTLRATNGATTSTVASQFGSIPDTATHLFLSVGGNDALMNTDLLRNPVRSVAEALALLQDVASAFRSSYERALKPLLQLRSPVTVCTIYHGDLGPVLPSQVVVAADLFSDAILRVALRHGACAIDLRAVCTQADDFVQEIRPSVIGGSKIARAIMRSLDATDARPGRITVLDSNQTDVNSRPL